jgi:hypothetical protein
LSGQRKGECCTTREKDNAERNTYAERERERKDMHLVIHDPVFCAGPTLPFLLAAAMSARAHIF